MFNRKVALGAATILAAATTPVLAQVFALQDCGADVPENTTYGVSYSGCWGATSFTAAGTINPFDSTPAALFTADNPTKSGYGTWGGFSWVNNMLNPTNEGYITPDPAITFSNTSFSFDAAFGTTDGGSLSGISMTVHFIHADSTGVADGGDRYYSSGFTGKPADGSWANYTAYLSAMNAGTANGPDDNIANYKWVEFTINDAGWGSWPQGTQDYYSLDNMRLYGGELPPPPTQRWTLGSGGAWDTAANWTNYGINARPDSHKVPDATSDDAKDALFDSTSFSAPTTITVPFVDSGDSFHNNVPFAMRNLKVDNGNALLIAGGMPADTSIGQTAGLRFITPGVSQGVSTITITDGSSLELTTQVDLDYGGKSFLKIDTQGNSTFNFHGLYSNVRSWGGGGQILKTGPGTMIFNPDWIGVAAYVDEATPGTYAWSGGKSGFVLTGGTSYIGVDPTQEWKLDVSGTGTKAVMTGVTQSVHHINIGDGAIVELQGGTHTLTAGHPRPYDGTNAYTDEAPLTMTATSTLDLNDNRLVLNYTGHEANLDAGLADIKAKLTTSFNNGWNGDGSGYGIIDSAAINDANMTRAIGYIDNRLFPDGVNPDNSIIIKGTYYGDADLNGAVTAGDLDWFLYGYFDQGASTPICWNVGDFDYNGEITAGDLDWFLWGYFNQGDPTASAATLKNQIMSNPNLSLAEKANLLQQVPEPTSLSLLALGSTLALRRRRNA